MTAAEPASGRLLLTADVPASAAVGLSTDLKQVENRSKATAAKAGSGRSYPLPLTNMVILLDGKRLASKIEKRLAGEVLSLKKSGIVPGIAMVLAGDDPASQIYVKNKKAACARVGIESFIHSPAATGTALGEGELLELIERLNKDSSVHGILVQIPLPKGTYEGRVFETVAPEKDVDCFHPVNVGKLLLGRPRFVPCTPAGILKLIESYSPDIAGKKAVVIGRSNIVGKPTAILMLARHATVTICHSKTRGLSDIVREADILVAAIGRPRFIRGDWIKAGAIVIDVGITRLPDGKIVGDCDFDSVSKVAGAITPVPGGVGPMTIAMLLKNTVEAARQQTKQVLRDK